MLHINAPRPVAGVYQATTGTNMIHLNLNEPIEINTSAVNLTISTNLAAGEYITVSLFGYHDQR